MLDLGEAGLPGTNGRYREITGKTCCFSQIRGVLRMEEAAASCAIPLCCLHLTVRTVDRKITSIRPASRRARQLHPFSRNYGSGPELNDFKEIMVGNSAKKKMLNQEKHKNNRSRKPTSGGYRLKGHRQAAGTVFFS